MPQAPVDLITVAREFGAGGSELAEALGARLGWAVLDRELPERVARRLEIDPEAAERMDEHPPNLMARVASAMLVCPPEAPLLIDTAEVLSPDAVAAAVRAEILLAARTPPLIVVGHGGQCLFRDRPGALHVRLVAPVSERIERACRRKGYDARTAAAEVRHMDDDRRAWIRRYHDAEWRDPLLYDVQINTGRVSIAEAASLIAGLVAARGALPETPTAAEGAVSPADGRLV